ncbi:hypothetical protein SKAU_G00353360 [Synaphobranchus kaupii]|uniref:Uncharacterized protein n=1 Tax=Synaphobranchus kaupii TaxID=118154 RepID=A0A9Q1EKY2_SYNKA|nr:hypothetical protein SKAU_G00353360 [Synaphobranchus kaupii]
MSQASDFFLVLMGSPEPMQVLHKPPKQLSRDRREPEPPMAPVMTSPLQQVCGDTGGHKEETEREKENDRERKGCSFLSSLPNSPCLHSHDSTPPLPCSSSDELQHLERALGGVGQSGVEGKPWTRCYKERELQTPERGGPKCVLFRSPPGVMQDSLSVSLATPLWILCEPLSLSPGKRLRAYLLPPDHGFPLFSPPAPRRSPGPLLPLPQRFPADRGTWTRGRDARTARRRERHPLPRTPARDTSETPSQRERIRSHMKMVIDQLEGILKELKDVAKELREVSLRTPRKAANLFYSRD